MDSGADNRRAADHEPDPSGVAVEATNRRLSDLDESRALDEHWTCSRRTTETRAAQLSTHQVHTSLGNETRHRRPDADSRDESLDSVVLRVVHDHRPTSKPVTAAGLVVIVIKDEAGMDRYDVVRL